MDGTTTAAPAAPETQAPETQAPATGAPETAEKPTGADIVEIMLGEGAEAKPVKVPLSKIPADKLNPHLAKLRSEADRRMSEADRRSKELDARAAKYDTVEKLAAAVQKDPRVLRQLAQELGVSRDTLRQMAEEDVAEAVREKLRADEEEKNPELRKQRERDEEIERLKKRDQERDAERERAAAEGLRRQSETFIIRALEHGFKGVSKALQMEAAREMVPVLRAAVEACQKDDLSDFALTHEDLARAARKALRDRAALAYDEDAEAELSPKLLERAAAVLAKKNGAPATPQHPAVGGSQGGKNGAAGKKAPVSYTDLFGKYSRM